MSFQNNIPNGIKLENTSFGQNAKMNTYTKPQFTTQSTLSLCISPNSLY